MTTLNYTIDAITEANDYPQLCNFDLLTMENKIDKLSDTFANICFDMHPEGIHYSKLLDWEKELHTTLFIDELINNNIIITSEIVEACHHEGFVTMAKVLSNFVFTPESDPASNSIFSETLTAVNPGQKVTIVKLSDFGFPYVINTTVESLTVKPWAQHDDCLWITHKPKSKRKVWEEIIRPYQEFVIYDGWINIDVDSLSKKVLSNNSQVKVTTTNYRSFDKRFISDIISAVPQSPLVEFNTLKVAKC